MPGRGASGNEAIRGWRLGDLKIDNTSFDRRVYVRNPDPLLAGEAWARPLTWAEREGFTEIAKVLRRHGAQ